MTALILVDIQNDFLEYGALAVPDGNAVIAVANEIMPQYDIVVATQDWHPANHGSFAANHPWRKPGQIIELDGLSQILWPIHCVQNSYGALFAKDLHTDHIHKIFQKGTDVNIDSYSGFYDNGHRKSTGMGEYLQAQGVTEVTVMGLATDYCVKFTALDALSFGFKTTFLERGSRGVNLQPDDVQNAIAEMREKGVL
jgi:nicotinamidase/pyrazinamidase